MEEYNSETQSEISKQILQNFSDEVANFKQVCPIEMLNKLQKSNYSKEKYFRDRIKINENTDYGRLRVYRLKPCYFFKRKIKTAQITSIDNLSRKGSILNKNESQKIKFQTLK